MQEDDPGAVAREQLERTILPFWLSSGIDHRYGGFFTCFDNRGTRRLSTHKFTWSQGRFVWLLARATGLATRGLLDLDPAPLLAAARAGANFLIDHAIAPDGTCAYLLEADGSAATGAEDAGARSVYADCFVAMGLVELARQAAEPKWLAAASPIIDRATRDVEAGTAPTAPYPVPRAYRAFGPRMILLNTRLEQVRALRRLHGGDTGLAADYQAALTGLRRAREAVLRHRLDDGTFLELIATADAPSGDPLTLLESHRTPGHALEGVWMAVEAAELLGIDPYLDQLATSVAALCRSGWDPVHGGLFRFVGPGGPGEPTGTDTGSAQERLVARTWSTKLWWVHTEAAYASALLYQRTRREDVGAWFRRVWRYTLDTFPAGPDGREWIQIRDRAGKPLDEVVALPVKDPYHISRNLMQIVELYCG